MDYLRTGKLAVHYIVTDNKFLPHIYNILTILHWLLIINDYNY